MGSLDLHLNTARQRVPHIKVGIMDIRCAMDDSIVGALAEWIVCDRVALITGWFGNGNSDMVEKLAFKSGACWKTSLYQEVEFAEDRSRGTSRSRGGRFCTRPSYFIIFGSFRAIRWPPEPTVVPHDFDFGSDLEADMEPSHLIPVWENNEEGLAFVSHLGNVAMKRVGVSKASPRSSQSSLWLGTATPSKNSQHKFLARSRGEEPKGKRKEKRQPRGKCNSKVNLCFFSKG